MLIIPVLNLQTVLCLHVLNKGIGITRIIENAVADLYSSKALLH